MQDTTKAIDEARHLVKLGRHDEALHCLLEAERNCKEATDLAGMAATLKYRIEVLSKLGRVGEAVLQVGRQLKAEMGEMPSDGGLPPDYWSR